MEDNQDRHLHSLKIDGFRALRNVNITSLSRINLFIGDNNVGKSTLLEAIYLFVSNASVDSLLRIAGERSNCTENVSIEDDIEYLKQLVSSFFTDWKLSLDSDNEISFDDGNNKMNIRFVYYYEEEFQDKGVLVSRTKIIKSLSEMQEVPASIETKEALSIDFDWGNIIVPLSRFRRIGRVLKENEAVNLQFLRTSMCSVETNMRLWERIVLTDNEEAVINILRIIEPDIKGLAFIEEPIKQYMSPVPSRRRVPYVTYKNRTGRYPLSAMGDGINRLLSLVLSIVNSEGGICLIDEIENGIYYKKQPVMWQMITHLATKLNVQIFAITHSRDCIEAFASTLHEAPSPDLGTLIRLDKRGNEYHPVIFTSNDIIYAVDRNIETR